MNEAIELIPSPNGRDCIGNGEHKGVEIQCDECAHYFSCFPEEYRPFKQGKPGRSGAEQLTAGELELIRQALAGFERESAHDQPQREQVRALIVKVNRLSLTAAASVLYRNRRAEQ